MGELYHVYALGDSTFDYGKALCDLVHLKSDPLVISFFEKTYYTLRAEILSGSLHPSLEEALTCAYQLGSFIR